MIQFARFICMRAESSERRRRKGGKEKGKKTLADNDCGKKAGRKKRRKERRKERRKKRKREAIWPVTE